MSDPFADYDAAYVLGALSPGQRREYEEHLAHCPDCAAAVAQLAGLPGLLGRVPGEQAEELVAGPGASPAVAEPLPVDLLPRLLEQTSRRRRRARWLVGAGGLAAAASLAALTVVLLRPGGSDSGPGASPPLPTLSAQGSNPAIHAAVQIAGTDWGSRISMKCGYDLSGYPSRWYALTVSPRHGSSQQIATWSVQPGREATVAGSTRLTPADIDHLDIRDSAGQVVLRLTH